MAIPQSYSKYNSYSLKAALIKNTSTHQPTDWWWWSWFWRSTDSSIDAKVSALRTLSIFRGEVSMLGSIIKFAALKTSNSLSPVHFRNLSVRLFHLSLNLRLIKIFPFSIYLNNSLFGWRWESVYLAVCFITVVLIPFICSFNLIFSSLLSLPSNFTSENRLI